MDANNEARRKEQELGRFIRERFASLCAMACKFVGDADTAQDIAQEVIIKYWQAQQEGKLPESVEDYLFAMVKNESLNYLRSRAREQKRIAEVFQEREMAEDSIWNRITEQETNHLLRKGIATLAPQSRRIMEMSYEGKSTQETADELGISANTVKVLKNRALQKLRNFFARPDL